MQETQTRDRSRDYYKNAEIAERVQAAARLVGHLATNIPDDWQHPGELYGYMDILRTEASEAAERIQEAKDAAGAHGTYELDVASGDALRELAHIHVLATAWREPVVVDPLAEHPLVKGGWWTGVASWAGNRLLTEFRTIADDYDREHGRGAGEVDQD